MTVTNSSMLWCSHFEEVVGIIITKIEALSIPQIKHEGDNIVCQVIENRIGNRLPVYLIPIQSTNLFILCSIIKGWIKGSCPYRDCNCKKYQICSGCCKCSSYADNTISWRIIHNEISSVPLDNSLMLCWEDKRKNIVIDDDFVPEVKIDDNCMFTKKIVSDITQYIRVMNLRGDIKRYNTIHHCFHYEK